jgi:branched-chain amino acid transport system substrate-binding protein
MTQQRWLRLLVALMAGSLLVAACGGDDDDDDGAATDTTAADGETTTSDGEAPAGDGVYKVGSLLPSTGALAFLGPPMIGGVEMAVQEINDAGGVNGAPMELVQQDDGTDPDIASTAADFLLAENVDVIVGAAGSGVSLAVIDKITGTPVVQCSPSNTGLQFTTYDDGGFYFRTAPPDNLQAQVLTDLITGDGHTNVAIIAQSTEYGEGFANALAEELDAAGVTVTPSDPILYDAEAGNYQAEAAQLAEAAPDAIAMISYEEGAQVLQAAIAAGVGPATVQWYGADGIQSSRFWQSVDPSNPVAVQGIRGTAPSAAPAGGEGTFRERFAAFRPPGDTIYSGHAYDCVVVAALAAIQAGSDAPEAIQENMNGITRDGEKCTLFADCVALLEEGEDIDYDGAAGPLDFIDAGEPGSGEYDTWQFGADGAVEVIDESIPIAGEEE